MVSEGRLIVSEKPVERGSPLGSLIPLPMRKDSPEGRNYRPSPRGDNHHTVRYVHPERQYGRRRCRGELSVAAATGCAPIVLDTLLRVDGIHRLLRADVLSPSPAVPVGG